MLRALGFGCCASAPVDVFFVFLDAALRAAFWHVDTRPFLLFYALRSNYSSRELLHSVLGRFDLSFSRQSSCTGWQELNVSLYDLKKSSMQQHTALKQNKCTY